MNAHRLTGIVFVAMLVANFANPVTAQFKTQHADLQLTLPSKPQTASVDLGDGTMQHRLIINQPNGTIIVWHQDANPQIKVEDALQRAEDAVVRMAGGKVLARSQANVAGKPARSFTVTLPEKGGEFRVGYYFANDKVFQVMSVGTPEFTRSDAVDEMFQSIRFAAG